MINEIQTKISYIKFDGENFEEVEKFAGAKVEINDDEHISNTYRIKPDPTESFAVLYFEKDAFIVKVGSQLWPVWFSSIDQIKKHFKIEEDAPVKKEPLKTKAKEEIQENSVDLSKTLLSPFQETSINIGNELERILTTFNNRKIHLSDPEKYKKEEELGISVIYNFNVGLLCGIKLAKGTK